MATETSTESTLTYLGSLLTAYLPELSHQVQVIIHFFWHNHLIFSCNIIIFLPNCYLYNLFNLVYSREALESGLMLTIILRHLANGVSYAELMNSLVKIP